MDWQRSAYIGGILVLSFVLLFKWNDFQAQKEELASAQTPVAAATNNDIPGNDAPVYQAGDLPQVNSSETSNQVTTTSEVIAVNTNTLQLLIDRRGGDIVKAVLPEYKVKLGGEQGFPILDNTGNTLYISQSGLIGANGTDTAEGRPTFTAESSTYTLADDSDQLVVDFVTTQGDVTITKRFTFERDSYLIKVSYLINNQSDSTWTASFYGQIKRDNHEPDSGSDSGLGVSPYYGAATTTSEDKYKKIGFDDMADGSTEFNLQGGWVAMVQHYFTSAWVPNAEDENRFFLKKQRDRDLYLLGFVSPQVSVPAGSEKTISADYYVGPKDIDQLEAISPNLDLTIDFGWLWWIAKPLFHVLDFLHGFIGNWGWSIIALTIIIKAIFFYPSAISYRSMAKMRKLGPKLQQMKEQFGDDRQKMSQEMMKLYRKEKVNPMGGCLPILIQMPVFISLYWVLMESVEIRHAPFMLWINDLSVMDPYFVLPIIMGATMFIQQKLNPTPPDPTQAKIMQWLPVVFTFMFLWFPAGLVVYWVTNNTLSIIQQYVITRAIEKS